jgi:hypothetical protein
MSSPVSQPVYRGAAGVQSPFKPVSVVNVNTDKLVALVRDVHGLFIEVRCDIMRAKGNLPAQGEQWLIDQQYGQWTFAAILNGGTDGVTVPQENVHGLPEIITAYDTRMTGIADDSLTRTTSLEQRSIGQTAAKGDLLAATAGGTVTRRPAGADGQVLVADTSQPTGLAYRTPLALTAPVAGATSAGRYVGNTGSGAPTSGTFAVGDWVMAQNGFKWVCTVAGSPGTWRSTENEALTTANTATTNLGTTNTNLGTTNSNLTSVTNRVSALEADESANINHYFSTSGPCASNGQPFIVGWNKIIGGSICTVDSGGFFRLNRQGRWSLQLSIFGDLADNGIQQAQINWPSGPFVNLTDTDHRQTGYPGCGYCHNLVSWSGWIYSSYTTAPFRCSVYQANLGGATFSLNYIFQANYMGGG